MINEAIETLPKLSSVEAQIVLRDIYDMKYGIFNHLGSPKRPLSSVAFHDCENYTEQTAIYDAIEDYGLNGYQEVWGLSVTEFLSLPQYTVRMIKEIHARVMEKKKALLSSIQSDLKNE